jgi:hypothetical protein
MITLVAGSGGHNVIASFRHRCGEPTTPVSASYKIVDVGSGAVVRAETALTPGHEIEILLEAADTALVGDGPKEERRLCLFLNGNTMPEKTILFAVQATDCGEGA